MARIQHCVCDVCGASAPMNHDDEGDEKPAGWLHVSADACNSHGTRIVSIVAADFCSVECLLTKLKQARQGK